MAIDDDHGGPQARQVKLELLQGKADALHDPERILGQLVFEFGESPLVVEGGYDVLGMVDQDRFNAGVLPDKRFKPALIRLRWGAKTERIWRQPLKIPGLDLLAEKFLELEALLCVLRPLGQFEQP
jgi:hypothetical protein